MHSFRRFRANLSVGRGARLILAATGSLQGLFDKPGVIHEFCNRQALVILRNDGLDSCAYFCQRYIEELNAGVYWADEGWKNVGHYLDPESNCGLWRFPNAIDDFRGYFSKALYQARGGNNGKAMFFLGAAAHLVQDLCVPHHASGRLMSGHRQYEAWAGRNYRKYAVDRGGVYHEGRAAQLYLSQNAALAAKYINLVKAGAGETAYHKATQILLPLAQLTTAGLFRQFFTAVQTVLKAA